MKQRLSILLLTVVLIGAACGSDEETVIAASDTPTTATPTTATPTTSPDLPAPDVVIPEGPAPTELMVEDLIEGDGPVASPGDVLSMHYVGVLFDDGTQFDESRGRGPFIFQLGIGQVIPGWDQGIEGMKVGGRRQLTIPPALAYGEFGAGDAIPPGATLVFVVDLLDVEPAS